MTEFELLSQAEQLRIMLKLARLATQKYALPVGLAIRFINQSENATFQVQAPDGRRWALRVHREGYHTRAAIASELAWLQDLRETRVIITPAPIAGLNGELIQTVRHPQMRSSRYVVLSEWETGAEPKVEADLSKPFEALGEVTARMHQHAREWQRPSWFVRPTWNFDTALGEGSPHWGLWRDGMGLDTEKADVFARTVSVIGDRLARFGQSKERFGLIHCDLRLANLLIDDAAVKVIDFDDCGFSWFMYDAATPMSFYEHEPQVPDLIDAWKTGYRRVAEISFEDEAEIPTFVMLRRILLVAWIGSHAETNLAKSMGLGYTEGTVGLCDRYLSAFG